MHSSEIDLFVDELIACLQCQEVEEFRFTLPPDLYESRINAKLVSSFWRKGIFPNLPEITQWIDLEKFDGSYPQNVRKSLNNCSKRGLSFSFCDSSEDVSSIYEIIRENRMRKERPIYLSLEDLFAVKQLFPVDFGVVKDSYGLIIAGAVVYRPNSSYLYVVFWADSESGRAIHGMDYLAHSLCNYYKSQKFCSLDLGISTEIGIPNDGLLGFKASHCAVSSLRYSFTIAIPKIDLSHESLA